MDVLCPNCGRPTRLGDPFCTTCLNPQGPEGLHRRAQRERELEAGRIRLAARAVGLALLGAVAAQGVLRWGIPALRQTIRLEGELAESLAQLASGLRAAKAAQLPMATRPAKAKAAPPPSGPAPGFWRASGRVYNLLTLRPVLNAKLSFQPPDGSSPISVRTDQHGRYQLDLPKADSYEAAVAIDGYRGQLADLEPPYAQRDDGERRATFERLEPWDIGPVPVTWSRKLNLVSLDLVLVP